MKLPGLCKKNFCKQKLPRFYFASIKSLSYRILIPEINYQIHHGFYYIPGATQYEFFLNRFINKVILPQAGPIQGAGGRYTFETYYSRSILIGI